jgi:DME family drug/metabolite transporter
MLGAGAAAALYQAAFFQAVASTGVAVGTLTVLGSAPIACGLLARWWIAEALPGRWVAATACAIAGCALLVLPDASGTVHPIGVALAAIAGACYGIYTVSAKRLLGAGHDPLAVLATSLAVGAVLLAPLLIGALRPLLALRGVVLVAWLGIVTTALAYVLFARGLGRVAVATAGTLSLAEPLTAATLGVAVLGERPALIAGAGATLLLTGLIIAALAARATTAAPIGSAAHQASAA